MNRIIKFGTDRPKWYERANLGEELVLQADQPEFQTFTEIQISEGSTITEAVDECMAVWDIHTHELLPLWISYTKEAALVAAVLNSEYGGAIEMREEVL